MLIAKPLYSRGKLQIKLKLYISLICRSDFTISNAYHFQFVSQWKLHGCMRTTKYLFWLICWSIRNKRFRTEIKNPEYSSWVIPCLHICAGNNTSFMCICILGIVTIPYISAISCNFSYFIIQDPKLFEPKISWLGQHVDICTLYYTFYFPPSMILLI